MNNMVDYNPAQGGGGMMQPIGQMGMMAGPMPPQLQPQNMGPMSSHMGMMSGPQQSMGMMTGSPMPQNIMSGRNDIDNTIKQQEIITNDVGLLADQINKRYKKKGSQNGQNEDSETDDEDSEINKKKKQKINYKSYFILSVIIFVSFLIVMNEKSTSIISSINDDYVKQIQGSLLLITIILLKYGFDKYV